MLKVSVMTRCPLMKTPNDPESTIRGADGFTLSFLSPDFSAARVATALSSTTAITQRIAASSFNRLLLGVVQLTRRLANSAGPRSEQSRLRSPRRCGCRFQSAAKPSSSHYGAPHRARKTALYCRAKDVARPPCRLAPGSAATTLQPAHPERSWELQPLSAVPRSPSAQTPRLPGRQFSNAHVATLRSLPAKPLARPGETPVLRRHGKSPLRTGPGDARCGHLDLQKPNSSAVPIRGPRCSCPRP